ncbi:glycerol-3-phosphate dehydrogenase [Corynebacterium phocae]|uniref:Glycerol-3-phosphate dehydrogenase n=1 Tax=Corynebacterium phocae TaxID=161895 RepID=A0A1L7D5L5_9CORY|nr:glycerol-3-phosphate dehydrogenase/oxidase [Corynebacterium phocae]APT93428.1 glycerol-3-phosphate dehydrogenase [Corynebacterium phocae]KAA8721122.1 glycerol-3-phosphate dehydrogenase/oxidase [Corynebacterium phocae]
MSYRPSAVLSPQTHRESWKKLGEEHFDLVIIGGGSVGAGAALDAATRGLKVACIEARDFAAGTSSRSSKMFHGGLRYLAMFDFALVAESLHERELSMSKLAPHLVTPLRFLFPLTHRVWERAMMFAGFSLYDLMGGAKSVPFQKHLSRQGALKLAPGLKHDALVGGVRYFDTLVDDARHTMTVLRSAAHYGATLRTSTQVVGFEKDGQRVTGATVRDADTGETTVIHADAFINATGVWTNEIQQLAGVEPTFTVHASKGVHIVIPKDRFEGHAAICFVTEKSVLFVIPWGEYWIVGTTDTEWDLDRADPAPTAADINYILDQLNQRVSKQITHEDIVGVYSGLRPLLAGESDTTTNLSRNHAVARVAPGLTSVAGGKYTTYRVIGKDAVDKALEDVRANAPESVTEHTPLLGADGFHALKNSLPALARRLGVTEDQASHLLYRYGSLLDDVVDNDPAGLRPIPGAPAYLEAEVRYAVTHEGALHLEDVLARRTRITMEYGHRGVDSAQAVADIIAPLLDWDEKTKRAEVESFIARTKAQLAAEKAVTDQAANAKMAQTPDVRHHLDESQDVIDPN